MPELPEVETVVRDLQTANLIGRRVAEVRVLWPRSLANSAPLAFGCALEGRTVQRFSRRGKFIVCALGGSRPEDKDRQLLIHLRMTGRLSLETSSPDTVRHARLAWRLDDGRWLCFCDPRKFGRVWLTELGGASPLDHLGVEPLSAVFTVRTLARLLQNRKATIKGLLLNQTLVAGLGNIYADEALWRAGIHPLRCGMSLGNDDVARLRRAVRDVLHQALRARGTSLGEGEGNFYGLRGEPGRNLGRLNAYRRTGRPCPTCATPIRRILAVGRGTHFCPQCQVLARANDSSD